MCPFSTYRMSTIPHQPERHHTELQLRRRYVSIGARLRNMHQTVGEHLPGRIPAGGWLHVRHQLNGRSVIVNRNDVMSRFGEPRSTFACWDKPRAICHIDYYYYYYDPKSDGARKIIFPNRYGTPRWSRANLITILSGDIFFFFFFKIDSE